MKEYAIVYKLKHEKHTAYMFGHDRQDAIKYFQKNISKKGKVVSARAVKAVPPPPPPEPVLTPEQAFRKMLFEASEKVRKDPYNGKAIGNYFSLLLKDNPTTDRVMYAVRSMVRMVENHHETFTQRKY